MKLLSLYIENFGKISKFSYDFNSKLNTIYEENGWGKSTIAIFLKAMLYGLSREEREKYTPWSSMASFGGTLVIESDKKKYRIDRLFSPKRASLDETKIIDLKTSKEVKFDSEIGEELLNLNSASFERSVFIPQKELDGFSSDIESKLANLIGGTNDTESYDDAINIIKNKIHLIKLNSKKGILIDKKKELYDVDVNISNLESIVTKNKEINEEIFEIDKELDLETDKKNKAKDMLYKYTKYQNQKLSETKNGNNVLTYKAAIKVLNSNDVSKNEIETMKNKAKKVSFLNYEYEILKNSVSVPDKYGDLTKTYNKDTIPSKEKIESIENCINKYENINKIIDANKVTPKKDKPILGIVLLIFSMLFLTAGVALSLFLFIKNMMLYFYISVGVTLLFSIAGIIFSILSFRNTSINNNYKITGGHVKTYDFEKIRLEEQMREFFGKFHLYSSNYKSNFDLFKLNLNRYFEIEKELDDKRKEFQVIEDKIKYINNEVVLFLSRFKIPQEMTLYDSLILVDNSLKLINNYNEENIEINDLEFNSIDVDDLNKKLFESDDNIQRLINDKAKYITLLSSIENDSIEYNNLVMKKENLEAETKALEEEYRILGLSLDFLEISQKNLLEKYVKPMKDSVKQYIDFILKDYKEYNIDINFNFKFVTDQGEKDISYYSKGFQTMVSLCMRLALINCLFPENYPFIVLDDPFVHLDDVHMNVCKKLISEISKKYQIMYFTCHDSRNI